MTNSETVCCSLQWPLECEEDLVEYRINISGGCAKPYICPSLSPCTWRWVQCALPSAYLLISTRNIEQRCALPNAYMHTSTTWFLDCSTSANWADQPHQDHNKQYRNNLDKDITAHLKLAQNF